MIKKRAQIALFAIIAIVIIAGVGAYIYIQNAEKLKTEGEAAGIANSVKENLDSCAKNSAEAAVLIISAQGGYILPEDSFRYINFDVAYWYDKGRNLSPSKTAVENEISDAACILMYGCIYEDVSVYNITRGACAASTTLNPDYAMVEINYPLTLKVLDKATIFSEFSVKVNTLLGKAILAAGEIAGEQARHPGSMCITCIADTGQKYNMLVDSGASNDTYLFSMIDTSGASAKQYELKFAMRIS